MTDETVSQVSEPRVDRLKNASHRASATARTALSQRLFAPVDIASLVFFRIAFGSIMLWEIWRYFDHGWIGRYYTGKEFYFTYWPFDFVQPWPGDGMFIHFGLMAFFAACIVLGLFYRVSATAFFLMFTYVFLLEQARYLNHFYLVCLIAFIMIFVPAHRHFSLDALLSPNPASRLVPAWSVWLVRFQVAVPMLFGGIAKLNADWLRGEPLRAWLADRTDFPLLGRFFTDEPFVWLMVYAALLVDLLFVFYMLNRRSRVFSFILVLTFHLINSRLFDVGIFPWFMIASTLVFFGPDWPPRVWHDLRHGHAFRAPAFVGGFCLGFVLGSVVPDGFSLVQALIAAIGIGVAAYHLDEPFQRPSVEVAATAAEPALTRLAPRLAQQWILALLGVWVVFQVLLPLRHFAIPGNVHWTEEGHNFAWHMKLRDKDSSGFFVVADTASGKTWEVDLRDYLNSRQRRKMTSRWRPPTSRERSSWRRWRISRRCGTPPAPWSRSGRPVSPGNASPWPARCSRGTPSSSPRRVGWSTRWDSSTRHRRRSTPR